jgi:hypothetical protein
VPRGAKRPRDPAQTDPLPFDDTAYNPYELSPRIRHAMRSARQARFEHGESGVGRLPPKEGPKTEGIDITQK